MKNALPCYTGIHYLFLLDLNFVENLLHFNLAELVRTNFIVKIPIVLLFTYFTKNIAYHIAEVLIFYTDKVIVMHSSKNLCVFNFAILFKSQKFDAHEIYVFYSSSPQHYDAY